MITGPYASNFACMVELAQDVIERATFGTPSCMGDIFVRLNSNETRKVLHSDRELLVRMTNTYAEFLRDM